MKTLSRILKLRKINFNLERKDKFQDMIINSLVEEEVYDKILVEKTFKLENETETGIFYFRDRHNRRYVFADEGTRGYRFMGN